jgi:hypothetical protein
MVFFNTKNDNFGVFLKAVGWIILFIPISVSQIWFVAKSGNPGPEAGKAFPNCPSEAVKARSFLVARKINVIFGTV